MRTVPVEHRIIGDVVIDLQRTRDAEGLIALVVEIARAAAAEWFDLGTGAVTWAATHFDRARIELLGVTLAAYDLACETSLEVVGDRNVQDRRARAVAVIAQFQFDVAFEFLGRELGLEKDCTAIGGR